GASWAIVNARQADRARSVSEQVAWLVMEQSLDELEKLPGTLHVRDMMMRSLESSLSTLTLDAKGRVGLAVTLARAHLKVAAVSGTLRGETETERNAAIRHCM